MNRYFNADPGPFPFVLFSLAHLVVLGVLLLLFLCFFYYISTTKGTRLEAVIRFSLAGMLILSEIGWHVWNVWNDQWTLQYSLPLQLCSVTLLLAAVMLLTRSFRLFPFVYFCGWAGALQALLTPVLEFSFPHFRFFHFFLAHAGIILAILYMVRVEGFRVGFRSIFPVWIQLNLLAFIVWVINSVTGGNYMFVSSKPDYPSLLDWLGPWPWYLLSLQGVAVGMFVLLCLPFVRERKGAGAVRNF
ncbi:TIGR02206 family membrane protein [Desmospora activa]|uniref:Putative integral membrane protein (TIGR02206 family) n=1 Tax=Desmospora activa DSM 45169 TaxID=1121389 RepID=A0A2T4ZDA3_9BACL|nr:TIGR02206 family membrane protein [Desmospora activa]PTM59856.1 putative integral membrane protein (TIGR02206 family) [Desmospora activa DSM 45169]